MRTTNNDTTMIPVNQDIERRVFGGLSSIGEDGDILDSRLTPEERRIEEMLQQGKQQEAAMFAMQLIKSICRHFVIDEHYNYFDDLYSPDYTITSIIDRFEELHDSGTLKAEVWDFLQAAWKEIQEEESYREYGIPSAEIGAASQQV
jgi:hypothetical protein